MNKKELFEQSTNKWEKAHNQITNLYDTIKDDCGHCTLFRSKCSVCPLHKDDICSRNGLYWKIRYGLANIRDNISLMQEKIAATESYFRDMPEQTFKLGDKLACEALNNITLVKIFQYDKRDCLGLLYNNIHGTSGLDSQVIPKDWNAITLSEIRQIVDEPWTKIE